MASTYRHLLLFVPLLALGVGAWRSTPTPAVHAAAPPATFATAAVPFMQKNCYGCHNDKVKKADLHLTRFTDEASVVADRKTWMSVLRVVQGGEMPPASKPRPDLAEQEQFVKTIQDIFNRADASAKPDPGRVTIRRLNRVEYNHTIRDLVGVDFDPTEDFPSDDIGYGFDNIGDVLTLSPVLMERYLAAAESIMNRAIAVEMPKPPQRHLGAQYTEPASANVPMKGSFRVLASNGKDYLQTGPVHSAYQVPPDGEYMFRARVYAEGEGVIQAVLFVCGSQIPTPATDAQMTELVGPIAALKPLLILQRFDITAREDKKSQLLEAKVPAGIAPHRLGVALVKRAADQGESKLYVQTLSLEGPLDPRPATHRKLLLHNANQPRRDQTREVVGRFASRAYRRPATADEVERLVKLVDQVEASGQSWEAGVQLAFQAVLVSPKFLFRLELDDRPARDEPYPLDEYQLASRLSYFLWSTMPDDELFTLASKNQLTANLDAQVRRMLKDPKSNALVEQFALQWLQVRRLSTFTPDAKQFPVFNEPLRAAMLSETSMFFDAIMREDRSILDLVDADFTFLNEPLARHYGIIDTKGNHADTKMKVPGGQPILGPKFVRVALQGDRGGLLTQASILTVTSNPTRTSPVKRGRWVLEQILGTPPPPPPADVPLLAEGKQAELTGTLRQRMEQHRSNAACASCHARMDPIGFAFENFNAIGAFRSKDGEFPIDPAGTLPDGKSFQGPGELKTILKGKKELFARNLTDKMMIFALGRGTEFYDKRSIDRIVAELERNDYRFSTLVTEIVKSDPFRQRRGRR